MTTDHRLSENKEELRASLAAYLTANMLDGSPHGRITFDATAFLRETVDNVMDWLEHEALMAGDDS